MNSRENSPPGSKFQAFSKLRPPVVATQTFWMETIRFCGAKFWQNFSRFFARNERSSRIKSNRFRPFCDIIENNDHFVSSALPSHGRADLVFPRFRIAVESLGGFSLGQMAAESGSSFFRRRDWDTVSRDNLPALWSYTRIKIIIY